MDYPFVLVHDSGEVFRGQGLIMPMKTVLKLRGTAIKKWIRILLVVVVGIPVSVIVYILLRFGFQHMFGVDMIVARNACTKYLIVEQGLNIGLAAILGLLIFGVVNIIVICIAIFVPYKIVKLMKKGIMCGQKSSFFDDSELDISYSDISDIVTKEKKIELTTKTRSLIFEFPNGEIAQIVKTEIEKKKPAINSGGP